MANAAESLTLDQQKAMARAAARARAAQNAPKVDPGKIVDSRQKMVESLPAAAESVGNKFEGMARGYASQAPKAQAALSEMLGQSVDTKGLPFGVAREILGSDNWEEKQLAVQRFDPKATLHRDILQRDYIVTGDGKKIYVEPQGGETLGKSIQSGLGRMTERAAAKPVEVGGATVGGIAAGPLGAGGGGFLGYLADEAVKYLQGRQDKTIGQTALGAGEAAVASGLGEGLARLPGKVIRGGLPETITGATPEKKEFGRFLVGQGVAPQYSEGAPGLATAQWKVDLAKKLGMKRDDPRLQATTKMVEDFLNKRGLGGAEETMTATKSGGVPRLANEAEIGKQLAQPLDRSRSILEQGVQLREQQQQALDQGIKQARGAAETAIRRLRTGQGPAAKDLQVSVGSDIAKARSAMSDEYTARYQKLATLETGLNASTAPMAKAAQDILGSIPKDATGAPIVANPEMLPKLDMLKQLSTLTQDLPIGQVAGLRTQLAKLADVKGLLPSTKTHLMDSLYDAADQSVKTASAMRPEAEAMRAQIEKDYARDIKRFKDVTADRLVKEAGTRGSVDAENVIDLATKSPNQYRRIMALVGPETKRRVARGLLDDMIGKSEQFGEIDGKKFYSELLANSKILRETFGKDTPQIIQAARSLAALDGKLPLTKGLMPETVVEALERAANTQKEMDGFYQKNALAALAKGAQPGETALDAARKFVADRAKGAIPQEAAPLSGEAKQALKARIDAAANVVGATPEKRLEVAKGKMGEAKQAVKDFDQSIFGKMLNPDGLYEGAVDYILRPNETQLLQKSVDLYGPGSPQVQSLKEAFLRKAIGAGTRNLEDKKSPLTGGGIRDFLANYSKEQKAVLLNPGDEADLQKLSRFYDFAFPDRGATDVSAGLAGGAIKSKVGPAAPFTSQGRAAIARWGLGYIDGYLLSHPMAYKWLILGLDGDKPMLDAFESGLRGWIQSGGIAGNARPVGRGPNPVPQQQGATQ